MAELADAPVLGTGPYGCRFDPCHPHQKSEGRDFRIFYRSRKPSVNSAQMFRKKSFWLRAASKAPCLKNPASLGSIAIQIFFEVCDMTFIQHYDSPFGDILLAADDIGLTGLWFDGAKYYADNLPEKHAANETPILAEVRRWRYLL